ncbi:riboflavin synthase [Aliarcobacter thereius]|uniref:Riboflavin synthase n=2 Tax=Aliarcobacter thereius TaxID=544718 RepID=A0A1C0B8V1_9BACT|nr:riboflavin synthase [Aliarcobacter thereius]OCL94190.1 Riboflavin synthase [Aliarcobacter thereius]OCL95101.1 Riboflavin synthase [Aliarcobacter thereius LMG 24486]OCM00001.1 Riboflavin synthase [Aliarcobacter thereius]QBF16909.1 6,7-dimethyl-8-ribityllumazine synthase (riboflavin synthase, alpha subunit) [Aliarcobacter thereius LMG 24486]TLS94064.1 riboflavin synthase [Aliarcobacter thereius]
MFTGLIREMAKVVNFSNNILTLQANYSPKIGDSIAVNGACLTVIKISNDTFSVELSPESTNLLALENYKNFVHIEPAMQMGDRFEGHIVQGHIDCLGIIEKIEKKGNSTDFYIKVPNEFIKYMISKGSVAIDGISLTINEVFKDSFRLTIIPHTIENTLFKNYKVNSRVNVETDMFARYIFNMFKKNDKDNLTWESVDRIMANY